MALQSATALASITLQSASTIVTFSNIPATYRDLIIIYTGTQTSSSGEVYIRYNGDIGSNYSTVQMGGQGSASGFASSFTNNRIVPAANIGESTSIISSLIFTVFDYSAADKHKASLLRMNTPNLGTNVQTNRWANINPINTISLEAGFAGQLAAGSTFYLYGRIA